MKHHHKSRRMLRAQAELLAMRRGERERFSFLVRYWLEECKIERALARIVF